MGVGRRREKMVAPMGGGQALYGGVGRALAACGAGDAALGDVLVRQACRVSKVGRSVRWGRWLVGEVVGEGWSYRVVAWSGVSWDGLGGWGERGAGAVCGHVMLVWVEGMARWGVDNIGRGLGGGGVCGIYWTYSE